MQRTTEDLLRMSGKEFKNLGEKDLRKYVSDLRSTARKRVARLEKAGLGSQASTFINKGGLPTVKGLGEDELRNEFMRYKSFLENKTSTVTGAKEFRSGVIEGLGSKGVDISNEDFDRFFKVYNDLKEISPEIEERRFKYSVMRELADKVQEGKIDFENLILEMQEKIDQVYEEMEEVDDYGVSEFF